MAKTFSCDIHGHKLELVNNAKYQGVTIEKNITWSRQIVNIHAKGNGLFGFEPRIMDLPIL